MAIVDADDDTIDRYIVWIYRYDSTRNERRNVAEVAFDNEQDFRQHMSSAAAELVLRKERGEAEEVEHYSGTFHEAGYRAKISDSRLGRKSRAAGQSLED